MARLVRIAGWGLVAALGLSTQSHAQNPPPNTIQGCVLTGTAPNTQWSCSDQGLARAQVDQRRGQLEGVGSQAVCQSMYGVATYSGTFRTFATSNVFRVEISCQRTSGIPQDFGWAGPSSQWNPVAATWSASCATREARLFDFVRIEPVAACHQGCYYTIGAKACDFIQGVYTCAAYGTPTGQTWSCGNTTTPIGLPVADKPQDPPPDPDPDPTDPPPPPPPDPDEPPPDEPGDGTDDGSQVVDGLGPKLDAIEQAVLGLGPRIDAVRSSVDAARADANTDADRLVSAADAIRAAIVAQGPNGAAVGGGGQTGGTVTGGLDCNASPSCSGDAVQCAIVRQSWETRCAAQRTADVTQSLKDQLTQPGPTDDGETPEVWAEADGADMVSMLDDAGFGWSRSCPQLPTVSIMGRSISADPTGDACDFLQLLANLILMAGFAHAGYIVASRGRA